MALTLPTATRNAACDAVVDLVDAGGTGSFDIYTTALGTLLAECAASATAFGAASTGVATANSISDDTSANDTGTAASGQIVDGSDAQVIQFSVGTSGEDLNLNTVSITSGDTVSITSATITMPAS